MFTLRLSALPFGCIGRLLECTAALFLCSLFYFVFAYLFTPSVWLLFHRPAGLFPPAVWPVCFSSGALFSRPLIIIAGPESTLKSIIYSFIVNSQYQTIYVHSHKRRWTHDSFCVNLLASMWYYWFYERIDWLFNDFLNVPLYLFVCMLLLCRWKDKLLLVLCLFHCLSVIAPQYYPILPLVAWFPSSVICLLWILTLA